MDLTTAIPAPVDPGEIALHDRIITPAGDEAEVWTRETGDSTWVLLGVRLASGQHESWSYGPDHRVELLASGRAA